MNLDCGDVGSGGNTGVRPGSLATKRCLRAQRLLHDPGGTHDHFLSPLSRQEREAEPCPYAGSRLLLVSSRLALPGAHTPARAQAAWLCWQAPTRTATCRSLQWQEGARYAVGQFQVPDIAPRTLRGGQVAPRRPTGALLLAAGAAPGDRAGRGEAERRLPLLGCAAASSPCASSWLGREELC